MAFQTQKSSNYNYLWGSGLSWSDGKGLGVVNARYRIALTMAFGINGSSSVDRHGILANCTSGTQTSFGGVYGPYVLSGVNMTLGKLGSVAGFIGNISDFKFIHGIMPDSDIAAYLAG